MNVDYEKLMFQVRLGTLLSIPLGTENALGAHILAYVERVGDTLFLKSHMNTQPE